jgi:nucleoside-diphosphate-sugar epimerase
MRILLTGGNGFVGSHVLDVLLESSLPVALLLRPTAATRWIEAHLPKVAVRPGSVTDPASLAPALAGITHVIHCAGRTKALRTREYYETNEMGTRYLIRAVNQTGAVRRFVLVSSLAASHPAVAAAPAREDDPPGPVSDYGKSKLASEEVVRRECAVPFVILRPSAVYGPRDADFLQLFKAIRRHVSPTFDAGRQVLSLVFARDLAEAIVTALDHPAAAGRTFNVASPEVVTLAELTQVIANTLGTWALPLPLPGWALWPVCLIQEGWSRLRGRPAILSRQKYLEARAPGWVCDPHRLREELGVECRTGVRDGIARTAAWYRSSGWL